MKRLRQIILWLADGIWYACALLLLPGCQSARVVKSPPVPHAVNQPVQSVMEAAAVVPPKRIGVAWDYPFAEPVTFEVWASTNLIHWNLATNTTEKAAFFPPKAMEFYKVRAMDGNGLVSDWATTGNSTP